MAGEIVIPARIWTHRTQNPNGLYLPVTPTSELHTPDGWRLPYQVAVNYNLALPGPIPPGLAGTPAAKLRLHWFTASTDTTSTMRLFLYAESLVPNAGSLSISAWDESLSGDDVNNGAYIANELDIALSLSVAAGRLLRFALKRDKPGTGADTLAADAYLLGATFIADGA